MNLNKETFPVQKLPLSKKTTQWKESSLEAVIARENTHTSRKEHMRTAYGLYNSQYDEEDLKYVTNPYKVEDGFPAKTQEFNIIRPKIDLLIGEESKRPFNLRVIQTNSDVVTQLQDKKKELLMQYMMQQIGGEQVDEQGQPLMPEEIEKYLKYSYKSVAEETAYHSLNYLREKLGLSNEFLKGWKDGLIAGEEVYYVGILNGEPVLERVNPLYCDYDRDPDLEFIEDGDWFVRTMEMSPSTIYDRFFDIMDESDLDKMLDYSEGRAGLGRPDQVNTKSVMYKENVSGRFFNKGDDNDSINLITVWHGVWRSYDRMWFRTRINEAGEPITDEVEEGYKAQENEVVKGEWIPVVYEGYRVGEDLHLGIGPVEYQHVSVNSPSHRKLPYCGVTYSNTNSKSKSLVNIMKPLQYMYIILWYRVELALARDKGKVITMDITQIPKGLGVSVEQWMHYLSSMGVNFINPYDEGWDVPGREGGKSSQFNQITDMDLSMGNVVSGYIELLVKIEEMIGEVSGVSKARQGQIHERSLVGNVNREVIQSSHITEPLFWNHGQAKKNSLSMLLDVAKYAWSELDGAKNLHYVLKDSSRIFLDVEDDFTYADFDIFLSDSTKEAQDIEAIRTLVQPAMQSGATLLDAVEIISGDNLTQIKARLEEIEERRQELMAQQQQAEQQQAQMEAQMKAEENRIKEEDSIRRSETDLKVALIKAESVGDEVDEGYTDEVKLQLQKDKQEADEQLASKKLQEDVRKNKKAEEQREKEISIKRKQANKPLSSSSASKK